MGYTHGHAEAVLSSHRWRNVGNSASYLLDHLVAGASVLDVGCGPGTLTTDVARLVSPGQVVGIDSVESVLYEARTFARSNNVLNVEFHNEDAYALSYDDCSFDVVHAHQLLQHLEQPTRVLAEMARVCRPGGVVAAREADYATFTWYPLEAALDRWLDLYHAVARADGGEPDAGRRLAAWAHDAGLGSVTSTASAWCYSTPAERGWWADLWARRTTTTRFGERALELGLADAAELSELADAWLRWGSAPVAWFATLHGEIVCRP